MVNLQVAGKAAIAGKISKISLVKAKLMAMVASASMTSFRHLVAVHVVQLVDNRSVVVLARKIVKVKINMQRLRLIWRPFITAMTTALS